MWRLLLLVLLLLLLLWLLILRHISKQPLYVAVGPRTEARRRWQVQLLLLQLLLRLQFLLLARRCLGCEGSLMQQSDALEARRCLGCEGTLVQQSDALEGGLPLPLGTPLQQDQEMPLRLQQLAAILGVAGDGAAAATQADEGPTVPLCLLQYPSSGPIRTGSPYHLA
ncbi:uncharacterized protein EMH_0021650 [Eimeria mitis]|uniref:Uncharacterized protein n=1 Tax=Eimeria mitis TaxID=44415 RepID=U6KGW7_9EIME|nr:uncharacterized protein EMH_0021650 [Eimeria mitis]CDJ34703.1 hypothetical protein EMH_0021650 [Eimeria mitis]